MNALLIGLDCIHEVAIDVPQLKSSAELRIKSLKFRDFARGKDGLSAAVAHLKVNSR